MDLDFCNAAMNLERSSGFGRAPSGELPGELDHLIHGECVRGTPTISRLSNSSLHLRFILLLGLRLGWPIPGRHQLWMRLPAILKSVPCLFTVATLHLFFLQTLIARNLPGNDVACADRTQAA